MYDCLVANLQPSRLTPTPQTRYPKLQAVKNISDKIEAGQFFW
jgi:hypothetical protein